MKPLTCLIAGACALTLTACSSVKIQTDFDPQADFSRYETYDWMPQAGDIRVSNNLTSNDLLDSRIRRAVDAQLSEMGYRKTSSNPDFHVAYHVAIEGKLDVQTVNRHYGYGYGWYGRVVTQDTYVREYEEGTFVLDIIDAGANQLAWRGAAQGEVRRNTDPEEREQRVREVVAMVLERFPPQ